MNLNDSDRRFLERRRERRVMGLVVLPALLIGLALVWAVFYVVFPTAVNPWTVFGHIEARTFEQGTLGMYALVATVLVNVIFLLLATLIGLSLLWARHERRYLRLLDAASTPAQSSTPVSNSPQNRPLTAE
jgi:hypothetical protein